MCPRLGHKAFPRDLDEPCDLMICSLRAWWRISRKEGVDWIIYFYSRAFQGDEGQPFVQINGEVPEVIFLPVSLLGAWLKARHFNLKSWRNLWRTANYDWEMLFNGLWY